MKNSQLLLQQAVKFTDDVTLQLVCADALVEDDSMEYENALEMVRKLVKNKIAQKAARRERRLLRGVKKETIISQLKEANGFRRIRTLTYSDVISCIKKARSNKTWHAIGGGRVANCYKYPAVQTVCVAAVRSDGKIRVAIGTARASKGSSLTNPLTGLTARSSDEDFLQWANLA